MVSKLFTINYTIVYNLFTVGKYKEKMIFFFFKKKHLDNKIKSGH